VTWEILVGLITIGGFLISFCTVLSKNTAAMTELRTTLREFRENSDKVHNDLKTRVDKHGEEIDAHEKRIIRLEDWRESKGE
jgi:predicted phage gp36 major capsid-like protein